MSKDNSLASSYHPPEIIKGCWQFSPGHGASQISSNTIDEMIAFADAGITTFDCADIYEGTEEMLGSFKKEYRMLRGSNATDAIRIHTKFVPDLDELPKIGRQYIESIIDRSLSRLQMDCLNLVQFHWWDFTIPGSVETVNILADLQREGKIEHIGVTNCDVKHLKTFVDSGVKIVTNQVQYSILDRRPRHAMADYCRENDIGMLCYGGVSGGFLSNGYLGIPEPVGPLNNRSLVKYKLIIDDVGGWEVYQSALEKLAVIAKKHNASISDIALRFVLNQPQVYSVIVGASAKRSNDLKAVETLMLNEADMQDLEKICKDLTDLDGDVYELERNKNSAHAKIMRYNLNS
jgi:aryl-alcohol dehydrogenase-like predicted oxidoreductase